MENRKLIETVRWKKINFVGVPVFIRFISTANGALQDCRTRDENQSLQQRGIEMWMEMCIIRWIVLSLWAISSFKRLLIQFKAFGLKTFPCLIFAPCRVWRRQLEWTPQNESAATWWAGWTSASIPSTFRLLWHTLNIVIQLFRLLQGRSIRGGDREPSGDWWQEEERQVRRRRQDRRVPVLGEETPLF